MDVKALEAIRKRDGETYGTPLHDMTTGALVHAVCDRHALLDELDLQEHVNVTPVAWIRGIHHDTDMGTDYDEEVAPGRDMPAHGKGWCPLYARPGGTLGLLAACLDAMKISMRDNGGKSDWSLLITGIEAHFAKMVPATPAHTTAAPTRTDEG